MAFVGTMTLRPQTLLGVLVDLLESLTRHGFQRCLVINGHGGNMATIMAAFSELHARASLASNEGGLTLRCRLRNWWSPQQVGKLQTKLFGDRDGSHATASEISLTQYALPDTIRQGELDPAVAPASSGFTDASDFRERYPDGRVGSDPSLASPCSGEQLYHAAVEALSEDYIKLLAEP